MKCDLNKVEGKSLKGYLNIHEVPSDLFSSNHWEMKDDITQKLAVCKSHELLNFIRKSHCSLFDAAAPSGLCSVRRSDFLRELHPLTDCLWTGASTVLSSYHYQSPGQNGCLEWCQSHQSWHFPIVPFFLPPAEFYPFWVTMSILSPVQRCCRPATSDLGSLITT